MFASRAGVVGLKRYCLRPGCGALVERGYCATHAKPMVEASQRYYDGTAGVTYSCARWLRLRAAVLLDDPLCVECTRAGAVEPATEVDHIIPHRGDVGLFWDRANLQGLCRSHHSAKTAREVFGQRG